MATTQSGIDTEIDTNLASGKPGGILAVDLRPVLHDINAAVFAGAGGVQNEFGTVAQVQSAHIPTSVSAIKTLGCSVVGDGGGALYRNGSTVITDAYGTHPIFSQTTYVSRPSIGQNQIIFITDSPTQTNGAVVSAGGGSYGVFVVMTGASQLIVQDYGAMGAIRSADGQLWIYVPDGRGVNARAFGAKGDCQYMSGAVVAGSTDNTKFIQDAIDFAIMHKIPVTYLPWGIYWCHSTLHLGWGTGFVKVVLEGDGATVDVAINTTALIFDAWDRPGIDIAGGRDSGVRDIVFEHLPNFYWAQNGGVPTATQLPLTAPLYVHPTYRTSALQANAPLVGFSVDAFAHQWSDYYPGLVFPSWVVAAIGHTEYNSGAYSSAPFARDCYFIGWPLGVGLGISVNANGDYLDCTNTHFMYCAYGVAVCNGESRNVTMNGVGSIYSHTIMTNFHFGSGGGGGFFAGPFNNIDVSTNFQVFDFSGTVGPCLFNNMYFEDTIQIGTFTGTGGTAFGLKFVGCTFNFYESDMEYSARACIDGVGIRVSFEECEFNGSWRVRPLVYGVSAVELRTGNVFIGGQEYEIANISGIVASPASPTTKMRITVDSCRSFINGELHHISGVLGTTEANGDFAVTKIDDFNFDIPVALVNAYSSGGVVAPPNGMAQAISFGGGFIISSGGTGDTDTAHILRGQSVARYATPTHDIGFTGWADVMVGQNNSFMANVNVFPLREGAQSFFDDSGRRWNIKSQSCRSAILDKEGNFTPGSFSFTGDTLIFQYPALNTYNDPANYQINVGDILDDCATGVLFAVMSSVLTGAANTGYYTITAKQLNNFSTRSGSFVSNVTIASTGSMRLIRTTTFVPGAVWFGDFTAGSPTVINVHRGDGYGLTVGGILWPGMLLSTPMTDVLASSAVPAGTYIGSITKPVYPDGTVGDGSGQCAKIALTYYDLSYPKNAVRTGRFPLTTVELDFPRIPVGS